MIRTESDVHTDRMNTSMANGPTDSSVIPPSSDSAVHSLGERLIQRKSCRKVLQTDRRNVKFRLTE